jgi:S-adenosyl-L-methionine hydrolase (adenosine-forming)
MKRSGIITLTTDFGIVDPYLAMMKGVILSINNSACIVDINHHIMAGSIIQAAGMIRETFPFFPEGTVHMAVVDPGVGSDRRLITLKAGGHLFVGPDNGIFWPVIADYRDTRIVHITESGYFLPLITPTFHGRDVFAPIAAHLSLGVDPMKMGPVIKDPVRLSAPRPRTMNDILYGQVMRVDNFGNLITNINHDDLKNFLGESKPIIYIGNLEIKKVDNIYSDVDKGEVLALIDSSNLLEIAVNLGRAAEYVGLHPSEIIGSAVKVSRYE